MWIVFLLALTHCFGAFLREDFANGLWLETEYDEQNRLARITFPDESSAEYEYDASYLRKVTRTSQTGAVLYQHTYDDFDAQGRLIRETHRSEVLYGYDTIGRPAYRSDCYLTEQYQYDHRGNLIQRGDKTYSYDANSQMIAESPGGFFARYDESFNCTELNGQPILATHVDDARHTSDLFDSFGRRLTHGDASYVYLGNEEIGSFENGHPKELRIPGAFRRAIAIEIDSIPYIPIHDVQGTIRYLIDWQTGAIKAENHCDAFGRGVNFKIPYAYFGKRYDPETGLYYFGKRFYDPQKVCWTAPDPLGAIHSQNLYQYAFNNPFRYIDPYGESLWGYIVGVGEIVLGGTLCVTGGILEVASFGTYTIGFGVQEAAGIALMTDGLGRSIYSAQDPAMYKGKSGHQRDGTPGWNKPQNKQFEDAVKEVERKIGRKLRPGEWSKLHGDISGRNYGYHDIVEEGVEQFGRR